MSDSIVRERKVEPSYGLYTPTYVGSLGGPVFYVGTRFADAWAGQMRPDDAYLVPGPELGAWHARHGSNPPAARP